MTIGSTFPVRGDDKIKSIPWGMIEPHRARAAANHGLPLERLYALGGLTVLEIARIVSDKDANASISDDDARAAVSRHERPKPKDDATARPDAAKDGEES